MTITIRPLQPADIPAAEQVIQLAFERPVRFAPTLELHLELEPKGFWVAAANGEIVGTASALTYDRFAYIGLMTVHPAAQRQGLGRRMMQHVLDYLRHRNCPMALLDASPVGAPLYTSLGFVDDSLAREFIHNPAIPAQGTAPHAVSIADAASLEAIVALDSPWFGACRRALLRALLRRHPGRCLLQHDARGKLRGYLFARDGLLGPWVAADTETAEALLAAALQLPRGETTLVYVPRSNDQCSRLLSRWGFVERRSLRHMRLGGTSSPGDARRLFGQTSFGYG